MCEAIAENWSARLDKSYSVQKSKGLYNMYEKRPLLLGNAFNAICAVYLLLIYKCRPPGGVESSKSPPTSRYLRDLQVQVTF